MSGNAPAVVRLSGQHDGFSAGSSDGLSLLSEHTRRIQECLLPFPKGEEGGGGSLTTLRLNEPGALRLPNPPKKRTIVKANLSEAAW